MAEPRVVAEGEVPFAVLADGSTVMARYRTIYHPQPPHSLSDPESTRWSLTRHGQELALIGPGGQTRDRLPIGANWADGSQPALPATAEGARHVVTYDFFQAHHLGWLSGPVTITFDLAAMTATVIDHLTFDAS